MAMTSISDAARNAMCDALTALFDAGGAGTMELQVAPSTEVATLTFSATAFGVSGAVNPGECVSAAVTSDTSATGNASAVDQAECKNNAGTRLFLLSAGTSGTDVILSTAIIGAGATVSMALGGMTITVPAA